MSLLRRIFAFCLVLSLPAGLAYSVIISSEQILTINNQFKFSQDSQPPLLPVEIGGREYLFMLDTGTFVTVYDATLRPLLGEPVESGVVNTPHSEIKVIFYSSPQVRIGHFNLAAKSPVLCMDLEGFRKSVNENIYGCLGMDFLGDHVLRIDFDRGEVIFLRSADMETGIRIPITYHKDGTPQIQATIPGLAKPELFLIDIGCSHKGDGNLRNELFDSLCEKRILMPSGQQSIVTLSGSGFRRQGRLPEFSLGCFSQQDLLFCSSFNCSSLGINYWSRYIITFDFPNGVIYLKERKGKSGQRKGN